MTTMPTPIGNGVPPGAPTLYRLEMTPAPGQLVQGEPYIFRAGGHWACTLSQPDALQFRSGGVEIHLRMTLDEAGCRWLHLSAMLPARLPRRQVAAQQGNQMVNLEMPDAQTFQLILYQLRQEFMVPSRLAFLQLFPTSPDEQFALPQTVTISQALDSDPAVPPVNILWRQNQVEAMAQDAMRGVAKPPDS